MLSNPIWRRARLLSGLLLMLFVTMHLTNLSIGIVSVDAMERWRSVLLAPWQLGPAQALLLAAALVHMLLGLLTLAGRRTLRLSRADWVQLLLGLAIPPLLVTHVVALQVSSDLDRAFDADYGFVLAVYWRYVPLYALQQIAVVMAVYVHGAVGLQAWLVLRPSWPRLAPVVLPLAFALPVLALLGFAQAGQEVLGRLDDDPLWAARIARNLDVLTGLRERLDRIEAAVLLVYAGALSLALVGLARNLSRSRRSRVPVRYDDGTLGFGRVGLSLLDVSRISHVPHAQVCSGRGRCGTCAVSVIGDDALDGIGEAEAETLARTRAPAGARLACQAHLAGPAVEIARLYPVYADAETARDAAPSDTAVLQDATP